MKSEHRVRELLGQYEFEQAWNKELGIEPSLRADLIIKILSWVLEDDEYDV